MGTDVYLEWEGKTEEEQKAQYTGWSIEGGFVGYLRASIGMARENAVLRLLFADKYWAKRSPEEYDFKGNFEMLNAIGFRYLLSVVTGKPFDIGEDKAEAMKPQHEQALAVLGAVRQLGERLGASEKMKVYVGGIDDFRSAVSWLNSLFSFFELGIEKQEAGLKPYPYISW